jgi:hypothetical protein
MPCVGWFRRLTTTGWVAAQYLPESTLPTHLSTSNIETFADANTTVTDQLQSCDDTVAFYNFLAKQVSRAVLVRSNLPLRWSFSACQRGGRYAPPWA